MADASLSPSVAAHSPRTESEVRTIGGASLPLFVMIFLVGLLIPLIINAGGVRLSVYRLVLLAMFIPSLLRLVTGQVGRLLWPDYAVIVICVWSSLSLLVVHGPIVETIGILVLETMGTYLIGRCYIRTPAAFLATCRLLLGLAIVMFPFAIMETITGSPFVLNIFDMVGRVYDYVPKDKRWGLTRVQGPFAHQIHFGLFFGVMAGLVFYVVGYGKAVFARLWRTAVVSITAALALSSGPLTALVAQVYMVFWDLVMRRVKSRWYILGGLVILAYITIDILSNRNPFQVFISYFAFNAHTAFNRIHIWNFGTASIFNNPVWGIGLSDNWVRPVWMSPSADMFWILPAMRHGIVVWIAYFTLLLSLCIPLAFRKLSERLNSYRIGYLVSMAGFFMAGWTVHYWDAVFAFFMFFVGAGVWMLKYEEPDEDTQTDAGPSEHGQKYSSNSSMGTQGQSRKNTYSRFPPKTNAGPRP